MSANPTGPLSVGHGRQAVLGDCIARLLEAAGWKVTREYYFNNGGRQMRVLGESVKARYLELLGRAAPPPKEALEDANLPWPEAIDGKPVLFPRDGYQGGYIVEIAEAIRAREGEGWVDEPGDARLQGGGRGDDLRRHQGHARAARHPLRRLLQRDVALRDEEDRGRARGSARHGQGLRPGRRGVAARAGPRAPARPRAREELWRAHVSAARHRVPPREVPPRLRPHRGRDGRRPRGPGAVRARGNRACWASTRNGSSW